MIYTRLFLVLRQKRRLVPEVYLHLDMRLQEMRDLLRQTEFFVRER
jgi:hypothetical protein